MSVSPSLRAAARSAYRNLLRASASTFAGDVPIQQAFRVYLRTDVLALDNVARNDPSKVKEKIQLAKELASTLRKNVVQAEKVETFAGETAWRLRMTEETEIGDNSTIKNPSMVSGRQARKMEKDGTMRTENAAPPKIPVPRNFSALRRAYRERKMPELPEEDLEETFVRGSGPGGQSINKTENNVQLLHKPTGFRVACQETRSLATNRMLARRRLLEKLDKLYNPGLSKGEFQRAKQNERERQRRKKAKKKAKNSLESEKAK